MRFTVSVTKMGRAVMGKPKIPLADRFWPKVEVRGPDECWPWQAYVAPNGYGRFFIERCGSTIKWAHAHRVAFELTRGPIPNGMSVCHHCDNRICCNQAHFFIGTDLDNSNDKITKGRGSWVHGAQHYSTNLSGIDVVEIRNLVAAGEKQKRVAFLYGIGQSAVSQIVTRKTWRHVE